MTSKHPLSDPFEQFIISSTQLVPERFLLLDRIPEGESLLSCLSSRHWRYGRTRLHNMYFELSSRRMLPTIQDSTFASWRCGAIEERENRLVGIDNDSLKPISRPSTGPPLQQTSMVNHAKSMPYSLILKLLGGVVRAQRVRAEQERIKMT